MSLPQVLTAILACATCATSAVVRRQSSTSLDQCPGYSASNVVQNGDTITADLNLAGTRCNVYGYDLTDLKLFVQYETDTRLHVKIYDAAQVVYQVPTEVLPRPAPGGNSNADSSSLSFEWTNHPFTFKVIRKSNQDVLFDSSAAPLVIESQYLRLRTKLPDNPYLYGLGEHTDPFRLNTTNYIRTLWSRDAYLVPSGTNLYGNHPVYFDHRGELGTHAVFLLNSNGMDIMINNTGPGTQYLEYNTLGGIIDLYFLAGPNPIEVAQQYSETVGKAVMMSYWHFGFHQCKYGYEDVYMVAEVVANYSAAGIPLETMWTDIDYMDLRKVFTLDPLRFPLDLMQQLVATLHARQQHYIMMVDPAVAYQNYSAYLNGAALDVFLRYANGTIFNGVVWPGVTVFPDWFKPETQTYWNGEFDSFFSAQTGVDIDALWIDMNEASNFCTWPCSDPAAFAAAAGDPPPPPPLRNNSRPYIPGFPADFQPSPSPSYKLLKPRQTPTAGSMLGLPGRDFINPPYQIHDAAGSISNLTIFTDVIHSNGLYEYDTHNLYGTMMSSSSRNALLSRRPTVRPLVITRSTFAGAGAHVGHWLGDNNADWDHYRISIAELMEFASLFQLPMVGSDVCGYAGNTTETLCARWATLGAFSPFYRNHAATGKIFQEFYRWPLVAQAAKNAIGARYRMLDYIYTALYQQTISGTPLINPLYFLYPNDTNTFPIQYQYFWGPSVLVSPVTQENETSVDIYLPNDLFYDYWTGAEIQGTGEWLWLDDVDFTTIPLHIRAGSILPLRLNSANTTTELRTQDFEILIAPTSEGTASGTLYLDDGNSLVQAATSFITFTYANGKLSSSGSFGYNPGVSVSVITLLGGGQQKQGDANAPVKRSTTVSLPLTQSFETGV